MFQYASKEKFILESGDYLPEINIQYHTFGTLNQEKDNVIWICHALTANSDPTTWWTNMVGEGKCIDTSKYFVVCANILGSCYGTTGPLSINPEKGKQYFGNFPFCTVRDLVNAHILLRKHLGIDKIAMLVGGSLGGYQALEWALMEPDNIEKLFLLATAASESAWGIGIHTAQRLAIEADATFGKPSEMAGYRGLKAARAFGMISYRNYDLLNELQQEDDHSKVNDFKVSTYLDYQGEKLVKRFNAYSYYALTKTMDSHNVARNRGSRIDDVLETITQPTLLIGIVSDILCPVQEQRKIARNLPNCAYHEINSSYGHDGFLIEGSKISKVYKNWMKQFEG